MTYIKLSCTIFTTFLLVSFPLYSSAAIIDFESLSDSDTVTNQYSGLSFTNAITLSSGISLNELEFPPHSGTNVVSDNGGFLTIDFSSPVSSFGGFFTYAEALTIKAFDSSNNLVASTSSLFTNNLALSGTAGSSPNEFLSVIFSGGISEIIIAGNPTGGSFVLDDLTYIAPTAVPIPPSGLLLLFGLFQMAFQFVRKNTHRLNNLS